GEPAVPALMHVTLIDPPPAVGGDALNPPTSTGAPAAIGSVCPVAVARGVDPSGKDIPQLIAVCANAALLPRITIMPTSSKGINSRLNVIGNLSFLNMVNNDSTVRTYSFANSN